MTLCDTEQCLSVSHSCVPWVTVSHSCVPHCHCVTLVCPLCHTGVSRSVISLQQCPRVRAQLPQQLPRCPQRPGRVCPQHPQRGTAGDRDRDGHGDRDGTGTVMGGTGMGTGMGQGALSVLVTCPVPTCVGAVLCPHTLVTCPVPARVTDATFAVWRHSSSCPSPTPWPWTGPSSASTRPRRCPTCPWGCRPLSPSPAPTSP